MILPPMGAQLTNPLPQVQDRYMIDYAMYRRLYPLKPMFRVVVSEEMEALMYRNEPPDDDFLACLPATVHGFSFSSKSWSTCLPAEKIGTEC